MKNEIHNVIDELKNNLTYQKNMGVTEIPASVSKPKKADTKATPNVDKQALLDGVRKEIGDCKRCRLCEQRTNIVFGAGNPDADLMFVGEGPGRDEDIQGLPFVGRSGQLLTKIINAMGLQRSDVFIGNVVKCRPPENRNPLPDEIKTCMPFLMKQLEIIKPKIIVCLGTFGAQTILATEQKITALRGKFHEWNGVKVMPTFHPAFLLRNPNMKKPVWDDMKMVMKELGI